MPRFAPVAESLGDPLDLPVPAGGKETIYSVPPCSAEVGLRLAARFADVKRKASEADDPDEDVADDLGEIDMYKMALGPVYDQMVADGVLYPNLKHAAVTAVAWHIYGEKAAALIWESGGDPKPASSDSASTTENPETPAAARSTRKPGSASGTTRSPKRARTGETSSPSGES